MNIRNFAFIKALRQTTVWCTYMFIEQFNQEERMGKVVEMNPRRGKITLKWSKLFKTRHLRDILLGILFFHWCFELSGDVKRVVNFAVVSIKKAPSVAALESDVAAPLTPTTPTVNHASQSTTLAVLSASPTPSSLHSVSPPSSSSSSSPSSSSSSSSPHPSATASTAAFNGSNNPPHRRSEPKDLKYREEDEDEEEAVLTPSPTPPPTTVTPPPPPPRPLSSPLPSAKKKVKKNHFAPWMLLIISFLLVSTRSLSACGRHFSAFILHFILSHSTFFPSSFLLVLLCPSSCACVCVVWVMLPWISMVSTCTIYRTIRFSLVFSWFFFLLFLFVYINKKRTITVMACSLKTISFSWNQTMILLEI